MFAADANRYSEIGSRSRKSLAGMQDPGFWQHAIGYFRHSGYIVLDEAWLLVATIADLFSRPPILILDHSTQQKIQR